MFEGFRRCSDPFGPIRIHSDAFGRVRMRPETPRCIWTCLSFFDGVLAFCTYLEVLGCFCAYLEMFGLIRTHSDTFGCIGMHSDMFGVVRTFLDFCKFFDQKCYMYLTLNRLRTQVKRTTQNLNDRLLLENGSHSTQTLAKRVSDDSQHFTFRLEKNTVRITDEIRGFFTRFP